MEVFNIICGVCSIVGLLVSVFTASKVIRISNTINISNKTGSSKIVNKGSGNTYYDAFAGRDIINGTGYKEHK